MHPFLGTSKVVEDNQSNLHFYLPMFPPKKKKKQEGKNKPTQKPSKEKRKEIVTGPKVDKTTLRKHKSILSLKTLKETKCLNFKSTCNLKEQSSKNHSFYERKMVKEERKSIFWQLVSKVEKKYKRKFQGHPNQETHNIRGNTLFPYQIKQTKITNPLQIWTLLYQYCVIKLGIL